MKIIKKVKLKRVLLFWGRGIGGFKGAPTSNDISTSLNWKDFLAESSRVVDDFYKEIIKAVLCLILNISKPI